MFAVITPIAIVVSSGILGGLGIALFSSFSLKRKVARLRATGQCPLPGSVSNRDVERMLLNGDYDVAAFYYSEMNHVTLHRAQQALGIAPYGGYRWTGAMVVGLAVLTCIVAALTHEAVLLVCVYPLMLLCARMLKRFRAAP